MTQLDGKDLLAPLRALRGLLEINDDLSEWRVETALPPVLMVMNEHKLYKVATEVSLDYILRLCKGFVLVENLLRAPAMEPLTEWWTKYMKETNPAKSQYGSKYKTRKPNAVSLSSGAAGTPGSNTTRLAPLNNRGPQATVNPMHRTGANSVPLGGSAAVSTPSGPFESGISRVNVNLWITRFQTGKAMASEGLEAYWSDDEGSKLVGKRIQVPFKNKTSGEVWYDGVVKSFKSTTAKHEVVYDDGDVKSYNMIGKRFRFL